MIRKHFYLGGVLLLAFFSVTSKAQVSSQSELLQNVAEVCGTGNHEPTDCTLLRQGAQTFGVESLDTLAEMLERRVLDIRVVISS